MTNLFEALYNNYYKQIKEYEQQHDLFEVPAVISARSLWLFHIKLIIVEAEHFKSNKFQK